MNLLNDLPVNLSDEVVQALVDVPGDLAAHLGKARIALQKV